MSTIEELKRLLEQAEARADKAEVRADKAESLTRNTTLQEYLQACHEHVLSKIDLDTRGYVSSKVPGTNPTGKHCPDLLTPWKEFRDTQADIIEKLRRILPSDERLFENIASLKTIGERISKRRVRSEASLVFIENNCVEDPVRIIIDQLKHFQPDQHDLPVHEGVIFATTASNLRDETDGRDTKRDENLRTDQVCVFRKTDDQNEIAYVIEYKAPHKLHASHLDQGLRPMSIWDEVVNKPTVPTSAMPEKDRNQHYAELLSAAAVTQTYHYMLEAGLEYGYVTNGDSFVFLKINWDNPKELFYHVALPGHEVKVNDDLIWSNAVCQVLAFTLLALQSTQHDNDARNAATSTSKKWKVDFEYVVDKVIKIEDKAAEAHPSTPNKKKHRRVPSSPDWSPEQGKKARTGSDTDTCDRRVTRSQSKRDGGGEGDSGTGGSSQGGGFQGGGASTSRSAPVSGSGGGSSSTTQRTGSGGRTRSEQPRAYCTPSCLFSLVNGGPLDNKCPNVSFHKKDGTLGHPVSHARWMELLRQQLSKTLVKGVVALNKQGGCGVIFQFTLLEYGYTFVAKGVTGRRVPDLEKEKAVYHRLQSLQGRCIPVCLGTVDLRPLQRILYYDIDVRLIYFLLLSYGGPKLARPADPKAEARIVDTVTAAVRQMHQLGVAHGDIRLPNVLQGPDEQVTIIDFDQAAVFPTSPGAMSAISPNKRRRLMETDENETRLSKLTEFWLHRVKTEDMSNAACLFTFDFAAGRRIPTGPAEDKEGVYMPYNSHTKRRSVDHLSYNEASNG